MELNLRKDISVSRTDQFKYLSEVLGCEVDNKGSFIYLGKTYITNAICDVAEMQDNWRRITDASQILTRILKHHFQAPEPVTLSKEEEQTPASPLADMPTPELYVQCLFALETKKVVAPGQHYNGMTHSQHLNLQSMLQKELLTRQLALAKQLGVIE